MEEDDKTIIMLPDNIFILLITTDLRDKIAASSQKDDLTTKIKDCLQKQLPLPMRTVLSIRLVSHG